MKRRIANILVCLVIIFLFSFCTRIENDYVYPDSTPYTLVPEPILTIGSEFEKFQVEYMPYADSLNAFAVSLVPSDKDKFKAVTLFVVENQSLFLEQVNFLTKKYGNAESIVFIPFLDDFNNNRSIDQIFLIDNKDSSIIQIRDQKFQVYPLSPDASINDEFHNTIVPKDGGFRFRFAFTWKISKEKAYVVFVKSNRLFATNWKFPDTLYFFNPYKRYIKKICLPPGNFSDGRNIFSPSKRYLKRILVGKNIFLISAAVKNGHNYGQVFNDYNSYLIALDTNLQIVWYDSLTTFSKLAITIPIFVDSSSFGLIKVPSVPASNNAPILKIYDLSSGKITFEGKIAELPNYQILYSFKKDSVVYIYLPSQQIRLNLSNMKIVYENLPIKLSETFQNPIEIINTISLSKLAYNSIDINNDGFNDLIIENSRNQICALDGKNNEILFATQVFDKFYDWAIGSNQDKKPILLINNNNKKVTSYIIKENSFANRLFANISIIFLVGIIIFIPVFGAFVYISFVHFTTLKTLTYHSESLGFCLIRQIISSKKIKPSIQNKTFSLIVNNFPEDKKVALCPKLSIPLGVKEKIEIGKLESNPIHFNIYYFDTQNERKMVKASIYNFSVFKIVRYYLVTMFEATDIEKLELFNMTLYSVHNIKNNLGIIQNTIENLAYEIQSQGNLSFSFRIQKLMWYINSIVNNLRSLLVVSNIYRPLQEQINLNGFIQDWLKEIYNHYMFESIEIETSYTEHSHIITFDERQLALLINCLVDNSIQALRVKGNNRNRISIRTISNSNSEVLLEIEDNGIGMSRETIASILDGNSNIKPFGTGLGFTIVKKICALNNIKLYIDSQQGKGTIVQVIFRLAYENN